MHSLYRALAIVSGLFSSLAVNAVPTPSEFYSAQELEARSPTCNTPSNRACWTTGFDINTDYELKIPPGQTRTYTLTVSEVDNYVGPDGRVRELAMLVNGKFGGVPIIADWGDKLVINVVNNLKTNGTAMHWHGIRQLNTNLQDGANGITECPIPPGHSRTYTFLAWQYGSSWYHSHNSAQYSNGVFGSIQINGPASLPYDIDLGVFPLSDYYLSTADELVDYTKNHGPPPSDNVLFNGTNINPAGTGGQYANVTLTPGKRHRLRIINTSAENHFIVSLDKHDMTIIESDFVPVNAMTVQSIFVGIGQRYDVTIDASQTASNYWFNVTYVTGAQCGSSNNPSPAAIFHYSGAAGGLPKNPGSVAAMTTCSDILNLSPVVTRTVSTSGFTPNNGDTLNVKLDLTQPNQLFTWEINATSINVDWNKPVDQYVMTNNTNYPKSNNIVEVDVVNQWVFWLVQNDPTFPIPHPFHLHGHDFLVLGRSNPNAAGVQTFNPATDGPHLNGNNPTRRDVTMLPALGWIVIAFKTDNPGAWLLHCHIAWHVSGGLAVQFLERPNDMRTMFAGQPADVAVFNSNCAAWNAYYPTLDPNRKHDSGLKIRELPRDLTDGLLANM